MPIPVAVPGGPRLITEDDSTKAEQLLANMLQIMQNGTAGVSLPTPPTYQAVLNPRPDPGTGLPEVASIDMSSAFAQLFLRQLAVAFITSGFLIGTGSAPPINSMYLSDNFLASGAITNGRAVVMVGSNTVTHGDPTDTTKLSVVGVANQSFANGTLGGITIAGVVYGCLSVANPGDRYFMGTSGQLVLFDSLPTGARALQVGIARTSTDMLFQFQDYGVK